VNESRLSRKKRSAGAAHDAAGKRAGVGAGQGNGNYRTDVVHVAPAGDLWRHARLALTLEGAAASAQLARDDIQPKSRDASFGESPVHCKGHRAG
jgi:hypothetical protein